MGDVNKQCINFLYSVINIDRGFIFGDYYVWVRTVVV